MIHNYGHIDGDSGLMTSQFHLGDSPKANIDYSHSERIETLVQKSIMQSEIRKRKTGESQSLIEHSNMQLNGHLLPQITLNCQSPAIFDQIALELEQYNYTCIMREANQMMFLQTKHDSLCQKIIKNVCKPTYIASQSNNSIILVKYSKQKLKIDALSGNYKLNEDVLLSVCVVVKRYNQTHKDYEPIDDMSHINPFAITSLLIILKMAVFNSLFTKFDQYFLTFLYHFQQLEILQKINFLLCFYNLFSFYRQSDLFIQIFFQLFGQIKIFHLFYFKMWHFEKPSLL
ncbi:unnamed protein product [Paramecium sonneborni]|uniref:Uncharacterized protein n=1 Tax=Paramecium sonneborni TaxID=65129 RepID=A0A8S1LBM6_9CILI|nr:unnamed protein product [Paramecium sonneborni]